MIHIKSVQILLCFVLLSWLKKGRAEELNTAGLRVLEQQNCGIFNETENVSSAYAVLLGSRPWMALIKYRDSDDVWCTGTLISERFVLTVAHCAIRPGLLTVRLGVNHQSKSPDCIINSKEPKCLPAAEDFDVERAILHEGFQASSNHNDIALLKLAKNVELKEHIRPICLPVNSTLQQTAESQKSFLLTGWGADEDDLAIRNVLREISLEYADRQNCSKLIEHARKTLVSTQFCVYSQSQLNLGISGSPLSKPVEYFGKERLIQFGIISAGFRSGNRSPIISTNVASFMPWITAILGDKPL